MRQLLVSIYNRGVYAVDTNAFFVFILAWFLVQACWLAYSAVYSLPFDEYYHFGIITIYSDQWSPFIHTQPVDATLYGDITRLPSYLYHYLMSFPYRLFELVGFSERSAIVGLRLINVAMIAASLILFRKLLLDNGVSKRITHLVIALFALTPIVPLLATHINYDNLMILLLPVWFSSVFRLLREGSVVLPGFLYIALGLFILLVKEAFAPLLLVTTIYVASVVMIRHKGSIYQLIKSDLMKVAHKYSFAAVLFFALIMSALFLERYGGNIVAHGSFRPDCAVVQSEAVCKNYMPWYRNQQNKLNKPDELPYGIGGFSKEWLDRMLRGYYATFSHAPSQVVSVHEPYGPIVLKNILLPSLLLAGSALVVGAFFVAVNIKRVWRDSLMRFGLTISVGYLAILFMFNFNTYLSLGQPQAIQARYTLPVLIPLFTVMVYATSLSVKSRMIRASLLGLVVIYLIFGGILNRLIQTDERWLWPDGTVISTSNQIHNSMEWLKSLELKEYPS